MEVIPEGTNFRLVSESELEKVLQVLTEYLPDSLKFHQTLRTYLKDKIWDFCFYVAKDWPQDPIVLHFPGQTETSKENVYESFGVFCPSGRLELLELLETERILIDWTQPIYLNFTHIYIMDRIEDFFSAKGGTMEKIVGDIYVLDEPLPEELGSEELQGEDIVLAELQEQHAKTVYDLSPANDVESLELFERLIKVLPAYGIFCRGELAAWMVQSYYGAMYAMHTRPEYRRKGFGRHLAQRLTKAVREKGYVPFVIIRPANLASITLYTKLGFKKVCQTYRAILRPEAIQEANRVET